MTSFQANQETPRAGALVLHDVRKTYPSAQGSTLALDRVSLTVAAGEFVSIIGHSGCGKSTLLRLVAGLDKDFTGRIAFEGQPIAGPSLQRGIVFQEHRLFPWLSVRQNVGLAIEEAPLSKAEKAERVQSRIDLVGLQGFEAAYPFQLSGGMAQRVAIARALTASPRLLLLDEPFGALDAFNRLNMQTELRRVWLEQRLPMVLVTHDVEEAIFLSDRVVVMSPRPGRIQRIVPVPRDLPRDRTSPEFVAIKRLLLDELGESLAGQPKAA
jgi:sulfonate transport system ATP-binding protein